jgi:hypothetical protein
MVELPHSSMKKKTVSLRFDILKQEIITILITEDNTR